jgi:hypothetical protein
MPTHLPTTGRISRRNANDALVTMQAIARSFDDNDLTIRVNRAVDDVDTGIIDAQALRALSAEINSRVYARLLYFATLPAAITPTTTITLYAPHSLRDAAAFAAEILSPEHTPDPDLVRLLDSSTIQTPTTTGTRYTFLLAPTAPAPSASLPA